MVFNFRFIESHIQNNQVGIFLILLVLASILIKNDFVGGILLALAVCIKITPLVFLFAFVYEKKFSRILWFFVGLFLWNALPLTYNWEYTIQMSNEWISQILGNALNNPLLRSWKNNQSLPSTLAKYFVSGADFINQPTYGLPFFNVSLFTLKIVQIIFVLAFGIPLLLLWRKPNQKWSIISLLFLISPVYFILNKVISETKMTRSAYVLLFILSLPILSHRTFIGQKLESFLSMYSILFYSTSLLYFYIVRFALHENNHRN
jgi:hypothetical protein